MSRNTPAFRNAAGTVASIYNMKADPTNREIMPFAKGGDQCSIYLNPPNKSEQ